MEHLITTKQERALRAVMDAGGSMAAHESASPLILVNLARRRMVSIPVTITEKGRKALHEAKLRG